MSTQPHPSTTPAAPRFWDELTNQERDLFVGFHAMTYDPAQFALVMPCTDNGKLTGKFWALPIASEMRLTWRVFEFLSDIRGVSYMIRRTSEGKWTVRWSPNGSGRDYSATESTPACAICVAFLNFLGIDTDAPLAMPTAEQCRALVQAYEDRQAARGAPAPSSVPTTETPAPTGVR